MRNIYRTLLVVTLLLCSGCGLVRDAKTSLLVPDVNLTENTYAAADMLAQQTRAHMTPATPLRIAMLTEVTNPDEVTPFGQQIANQLGSRFVQLGYNVQSVPFPPGLIDATPLGAPVALNPAGGAPKPVPASGSMRAGVAGGDCLITGTYTRMDDFILVSLKVMQAPQQRVIAAYDYNIRMTNDLRKLSRSKNERERRENYPLTAVFE